MSKSNKKNNKNRDQEPIFATKLENIYNELISY